MTYREQESFVPEERLALFGENIARGLLPGTQIRSGRCAVYLRRDLRELERIHDRVLRECAALRQLPRPRPSQ